MKDFTAENRKLGQPLGGAAKPKGRSVKSILNLGLPLVLILLVVIFWIAQPRFATFSNAQNVVRQAAVLAILSFGQAFPILAGGFDISVGSIMGIVSVLAALVAGQYGLGAGIVTALIGGGFFGSVNGFFISNLKFSPFIVTISMLVFARGLALLITGGAPIEGMAPGFSYLGTAYWGPIPVPAAVAGVAFLVCWVILGRMKVGRYVYAIGGNEEAARLSGINVVRVKFLAYSICGLLTGLAGMVQTSRVNSGQPLLGQGTEMEAIAAVVIGGVSIGGGTGTVGGVLVGVMVMSVIWNGLNLANVSSFVQMMAIGAIIILAVAVDRLRHRGED